MIIFKLNRKNFDSILLESVVRVRKAAAIRQLNVDELKLYAEFDYAECKGRSLSYDNKKLRICLLNYLGLS